METNRSAPTRDEIAKAVGLGPRSSIQYHIDTLVQDGYVERSTYRHRMIRPTQAGIDVIAELEADETGS
jgi:SOS-response transcriptional repressor LexA